MVQTIRMPMMGNTMEIGLMAEWRVYEGDQVAEDDVIAIVESEKASADVVADRDGVLARVDVEEGEEVPPGTLLGVVVGEDDSLDEAPPPRSRIEPGDNGVPERDDSGGAESSASTRASGSESVSERDSESGSVSDEASDGVRATPGARKLAAEHDVELASIEGTGEEGAVLRADVEALVEGSVDGSDEQASTESTDDLRTFASPSTRRLARELGVSIDDVASSGSGRRVSESDVRAAAGQLDSPASRPAALTDEGDSTYRDKRDAAALDVTIKEERELSRMRRTIADRMSQSARQVPHVTNNREVNAERALEAADDLATELDAPIGFTDILIAAVTRALGSHPEFNAWYEGERHRLVAERNVAVAVDTDAGLVTPVIRNVGSRTLAGIADERRRLTDSVIEGSYTMDELRGSTFTITNLGMFGVDSFDPIINPPQVAILGVGRIREDSDGRTCILSLSFDHRVVDGADAARFLETITEGLESPAVLTIGRASTERGEHSPTATRSAKLGHDDSEQPEAISAAIGDELRKQAEDIAAVHGWPVPEFEVRLTGERPTIGVEVPDSVSPATMKRLTYAACRESVYAGTISRLQDPQVIIS